MHKDEIKGKLKEAEGRAQDAWGDVTGNPRHDAEGKDKQAEGKMEQVKGNVKDAAHKLID